MVNKYKPVKLHRQAQAHALKFFNSCPWKAWWQEFAADRREDGRLLYLTSWEFAQAKAKDTRQLRLIYKAIGPKPVELKAFAEDGRFAKTPKLEMPYLGDWQQIRAQAYFYDDKSLESMKQSIATRLDSLEAGRSSATLLLDMIAEWHTYSRSVDTAFGNEPLIAGINPMKQQQRANFFFKLKREIMDAEIKMLQQYLACHGISNDGVNDLCRLIMAAGNSSAKAALAGVLTAAGLPDAPDISRATHLLSGAIVEKNRIFKLGMPKVVDVKLAEELEAETVRQRDE
jgi:hypothetical protein